MCTIWVSEYWILRPLHVAYRESNGAYKNCINILRLPGKDRNATHPPRHLKLPGRLYRTRPSAAIYAPNQPRVYDTVIVSVELSRHIEALHQQWHLLWTRKPVFLTNIYLFIHLFLLRPILSLSSASVCLCLLAGLHKQETQLLLTNRATRLEANQGHITWYHSTCYVWFPITAL